MPVFVSPGVYIREVDISQFAPAISTSIFAIVGGAHKGPIDTPTDVTSELDLVTKFGNPTSDSYLLYAGLLYLQQGRQLKVVRVADGTEAYATVSAPGAAQAAMIIGSRDLSGGVNLSTLYNLKLSIAESVALSAVVEEDFDISAGVNMSTNKNINLAIAGGPVFPATDIDLSVGAAVPSAVTPTEIANRINTVVGASVAGVSADGKRVYIKTTGTGVGATITLATPASLNVTAAVFGPNYGTLPVTQTGLAATTAVVKTVDLRGTGSATFAVADPTNVLLTEIIDILNSPLGFNSTQRSSALFSADNLGAKLVVTTSSTGVAAVIIVQAAASADARTIVLGVDTVPVTYTGAAAVATALTVTGESKGDYANGYVVRIANGTNTGTFKLTVFDQAGNTLDIKDNLFKSTVESQINGVSSYIIVDDASNANRPTNGDYVMSGGIAGISALTDSDYIGVVSPSRTGLQTLADPEEIDVNIVAVPGISSGAVVLEMLSLCRGRADCIALIDPPLGLTSQQVIDWHNGAGAYTGLHPAFNSSYGALYWPWVKMQDSYNNTQLWTPPSGWVAGQYALNDYVADPWFAPAGVNRGRLELALDVERRADLGTRDNLYSNGNAVNPIVNFTREGILIWGQRTLQRAASALDRVNVRRMLLYAEKLIASASKVVVFEPNDVGTWTRLENLINPILKNIAARRGIERFEVVIDESTNPPEVVNRNELHGKIFIVPTKAAEIITLDFVLLASGASFDEV